MKILPEVGASTPVMSLISVDLPAPLSPMRPTISLRPMERSMSRSACTAPKYFCTPSRRTMDANSPAAGVIAFPSRKNPPTKAAPRGSTFAQLGALGNGISRRLRGRPNQSKSQAPRRPLGSRRTGLADDAVLKNWSRRRDFVEGQHWDRETPDHALIWRKVREDQGEPPGAGKA